MTFYDFVKRHASAKVNAVIHIAVTVRQVIVSYHFLGHCNIDVKNTCMYPANMDWINLLWLKLFVA